MKIALVHDYLVQYGGAERVLEALCELYPDAPIYTLLYDEAATHGVFKNRRIYTSFLQGFPFALRHHRVFPILMPMAIEQFDFSGYDVVLSDSSSFAKGVITRPETLHVSYMHTPMRYAWDDCQRYTEDFGFPSFLKRAVPLFMNPLRLWDRVSASRVDHYLCNSSFVATRIQKYYAKSAEVIAPPVDLEQFASATPVSGLGRYYLVVGRLIAYKRHDIVIQAANRLGFQLIIIGRGPEEERLRTLAGPTVEFLGRVDDELLPRYYAGAEALIFPQEEDFGIVAIEALAAGTPVVAYDGGDIAERVIHGATGVLFPQQTASSLCDALQGFHRADFDTQRIRASAEPFAKAVFQGIIQEKVANLCQKHKANQNPGTHRYSPQYSTLGL